MDLDIGPKPVKELEANTVITNPDKDFFLMSCETKVVRQKSVLFPSFRTV